MTNMSKIAKIDALELRTLESKNDFSRRFRFSTRLICANILKLYAKLDLEILYHQFAEYLTVHYCHFDAFLWLSSAESARLDKRLDKHAVHKR